jgi:predicted NUDIX family NTP pyrophosphohydrolase
VATIRSAGLLMFRRHGAAVEVLLAHPGGPFWARRDDAAWTLPKGEIDPGEDPLAAARREFQEETGFTSAPPFLLLGEVRQKSGKRITAWAFEGDADPLLLVSNPFEMEWPPRSGRMQSFPEIDRVHWFGPDQARRKLIAGQVPFIDALERALAGQPA